MGRRTCWIRYSVTSAEKSINFRVQHQCPQCGAPVILEEETLFFSCGFCRVRSVISHNSFPRYRFSPSSEIKDGPRLIYLPYWRFKGVRYTCRLSGVEHKFLDLSTLALKNKPVNIAASLGFRSQALTLKMVSSKTNGAFIKPLNFKRTLLFGDRRSESSEGVMFRENIGETSSLIFSPFHIKQGMLYDSILNEPVGKADRNQLNPETMETCRPEKEIAFIPGLCPSCGWDLEGEPDSIVLVCRNCQTLWRSYQNRLVKIKFGCARPGGAGDVLLPFWKISADISHIDLRTYSDLILFANLPKVAEKDDDSRPIAFWSPAFKIRPALFLRLITRLTVFQPGKNVIKQVGHRRLSAVNLPSSEAVESIKIALGALMKPAVNYLPLLPEISVRPTAVKLVYLPFEKKSHELYHARSGINININSLKLSSNL